MEFNLPIFARPDDFFELSSRLYNHADTFTISQRQRLRPILESIIMKFEAAQYLRPFLKNLIRFLDEEVMPFCTDDYFYSPDDISECTETSNLESVPEIEQRDEENAVFEDVVFVKDPLFSEETEPLRLRRSSPLNFDTLSVVSECPSILSCEDEKSIMSIASKLVVDLPVDDVTQSTISSCSCSMIVSSPLPSPMSLPISPPMEPMPTKLFSNESDGNFSPTLTMTASGDNEVFYDDDQVVYINGDLEPEKITKKRSFRKNVTRLVHRVSKVFRSKSKVPNIESINV